MFRNAEPLAEPAAGGFKMPKISKSRDKHLFGSGDLSQLLRRSQRGGQVSTTDMDEPSLGSDRKNQLLRGTSPFSGTILVSAALRSNNP